MHHENNCPCQSCLKDGQPQKCAMVCGQINTCDKPQCKEVREWRLYRTSRR
jgi:hypothetical protein